MEHLGKIFGDPNRVKVMRLFLWNEGTPFTLADVTKRALVSGERTRRELSQLTTIGFLFKKKFTEKVLVKNLKKKAKTNKAKLTTNKKPTKSTIVNPVYKRVQRTGWVLNPKFELVEPLRSLLIDTELVRESEIIRRLRESGKIELLILSGIFVRDENRKVDVLAVGDGIDGKLFEKQIAIIESEVGRELSYSLFEVAEFNYRLGMYDKLLRDVLENHHTTLVDKLRS